MTPDLFPEARVDPRVDLDRRYTTPETMGLCKRLAGVDGFDLDVAADAESHWAPRWYGIDRNGLAQPWDAARVWCNPPYSNIEPWVVRAWSAMQFAEADIIGMLLPANRTDQPWWFRHVERRRDGRNWVEDLNGERVLLTTHFLQSRIRFGHPGNPKGHGVGSPPFGCVLLVWRRA